jgi:hypothetical protein
MSTFTVFAGSVFSEVLDEGMLVAVFTVVCECATHL